MLASFPSAVSDSARSLARLSPDWASAPRSLMAALTLFTGLCVTHFLSSFAFVRGLIPGTVVWKQLAIALSVSNDSIPVTLKYLALVLVCGWGVLRVLGALTGVGWNCVAKHVPLGAAACMVMISLLALDVASAAIWWAAGDDESRRLIGHYSVLAVRVAFPMVVVIDLWRPRALHWAPSDLVEDDFAPTVPMHLYAEKGSRNGS